METSLLLADPLSVGYRNGLEREREKEREREREREREAGKSKATEYYNKYEVLSR